MCRKPSIQLPEGTADIEFVVFNILRVIKALAKRGSYVG